MAAFLRLEIGDHPVKRVQVHGILGVLHVFLEAIHVHEVNQLLEVRLTLGANGVPNIKLYVTDVAEQLLSRLNKFAAAALQRMLNS